MPPLTLKIALKKERKKKSEQRHFGRIEDIHDTVDLMAYHEFNCICIVSYLKTDTKSQKSDDQSQYLYDLIGVTVHTGTADGGHYYSFIKDRTHSSEDQNRWYMFNDAEVKPFDSAQLASECFGGEMTVSCNWIKVVV